MQKLLMVEDSESLFQIIKKEMDTRLGIEVTHAESYIRAKELLTKKRDDFFLSLTGLSLPDAQNGEILDLIKSFNLPVIVFTGNFDESVREICWDKMVIDYVLKEGPYNLQYIVNLVDRIRKNPSIKVLVVDDSSTSRKIIVNLLKIHMYQILEAANGEIALSILEKNTDIKMVITDYNMPKMDGAALLKKIREKYTKEQMAVIGLSNYGSNVLSAQFIKSGANDFLTKPFLNEEFYCRITQNVEMIEKIEEIERFANTDHLTGLYNRRYFFSVAEVLLANAERKNITLTVAMLDIDFFKKINDTYGHAAGDEVLKAVAGLFKKRFRETDIVARIGGEEFCVLASNMDNTAVAEVFEGFRRDIEKMVVRVEEKEIRLTMSIGITTELQSFDEMLKKADERLYRAKETGRNRVVF